MSESILLRDVLLAGEGLAASTLLPVLALVVASWVPRRAALRHLIWLAAFAGLLALPLIALVLPTRFVIERPAAPAPVSGVIVIPARVIALGPATEARASAALPQISAGKPVHTDVTAPRPRPFGAAQLAISAFTLWLSGVAMILLYQVAALLGLARLRRHSTPQAIEACELQGRWQVRIAGPSGIHGPLTWGIWRPVILLPHHAMSWPRERMVAVLRHEIAHVRRHDMLTQILAQLACALYWPNPLIWLGARRMRREAEIAADDAVLCAGIKPSSYAETLMALAAEFRRKSPGIAMATPSTLEARVTSVLTSAQSRTGVTAMDVFKTACLGTAAIALMALARPDFVMARQAVSAATPKPAPIASMAAMPRVAMMQAAPNPVAPQAVASAAPKAAALVSPAAQIPAGTDADQAPAVTNQIGQLLPQADAGPVSPAKAEDMLAMVDTQQVIRAAPTIAPSAAAPAPRSEAAVNSAAAGWSLTSGLYKNDRFTGWAAKPTPPSLQTGAGVIPGMSGQTAIYLKGDGDASKAPCETWCFRAEHQPQNSFIRYGGLERLIALDAWRGKRLRLTVRLKNEGEARAYASAQINRSNSTAIRTTAQQNQINDAWTDHQFVLDVPEDATVLAVDVGLTGQGTIWLDGISMAAVSGQVSASDSHRIPLSGYMTEFGGEKVIGPVPAMPGLVSTN